MQVRQIAAGALVAAVVTLGGMLGFMQTTRGAPPAAQLPFANSVDQRDEMIRELREIKALLKEQNALLAAGAAKAGAEATR